MPFPRRNILPVYALSLFCAAHAFAQSSVPLRFRQFICFSSSVPISSAALGVPPSASSAAPVKIPAPVALRALPGRRENSPWFYLGVLYAVRDYHIPVDSVSGVMGRVDRFPVDFGLESG